MTDKQLKAKDAYYRNQYNISYAEYLQMDKIQGHGCAVCGRPPKRRPLNVDHDHRINAIKIYVKFDFKTGKYEAQADYLGLIIFCADTKAVAIKAVQMEMKRRSVRGLLCYVCNKFVLGAIERFKIPVKRVVNYLEKHDPKNSLLRKKK